MDEKHLTELVAIKKLLVVSLLNSGVTPEIIGKLIGTTAKTIKNQYPIKLIRQK